MNEKYKFGKHTRMVLKRLVNNETQINIFNSEDDYIGNVYQGDDSLTEIEIRDNVIAIHNEAFMNCTSLTTVTLPSSLKRIEQNAFIGCTALQNVVTPDSLDEVDCWLGNRGVAKLTLFNPSSDELVNYLKQGYAMDFHYKGESRGDHWA